MLAAYRSLFEAPGGAAEYLYIGSGGIIFGSTAESLIGYIPQAPTGGLILGGVAPFITGFSFIGGQGGAGGIVLGGVAPLAIGKSIVGAGGLVFGDAAPNAVGVVTGHVFTGGQGGAGGIVFGDSAPNETDVIFTPGAPAGGEPEQYHHYRAN
jgi:hypothetical protein